MKTRQPPQKTTARESGEAREAILREALALFTAKGYAATSVREIVEAARVTKPVLYYYFGNKEGLYLELIQRPLDRFTEFLSRTASGTENARQRMEGLLGGALNLFTQHLAEARLMYAIYYGPPQGAPHVDFEAYHSRLGELIAGLIQEGVKRKEFLCADTEAAAWILLGALNLAMEERLCKRKPVVNLDGLKRILDCTLGRPARPPRKRRRCGS